MRSLPVFAAEQEAGLTDLLSKSVAKLMAPIRVPDVHPDFDKLMATLQRRLASVRSIEDLIGLAQPDLALIVSILVSTGWNRNDDIFTPAETWAARETPNHKPINVGHDETTIIGHLVQSRVLDKDGNEIVVANDGDIPQSFDIEVAGVLYRALPSMAERIEKIIDAAKKSEMFVSMEAWFSDFAYGFENPGTGVTKIVARDSDTAFLTKHLRCYGGTGAYEGYRIGRVLLGITFAGKGIVANPANPESVIKSVAKTAADAAFETIELSELKGEPHIMAGQKTQANETQANEIQSKLDEVTAALEAKTAEAKAAVEALESLKAQKLDEQVTALTTEKADLAGKLIEATKRAETAEAQLAQNRKADKARERLNKLAVVKKIEDEAASLAELVEMSDETFAVVLKYAGNRSQAETINPQQPAPAPVQTDPKVAEKPEDKQADEATAALETANPVEEPDFQGGDDRIAATLASVAKATAEALLNRNRKESK